MSFFKDMTLERVFILLALLGSLGLLYVGLGTRSELAELKVALETKVPKVSNQIQQFSRSHTKLSRDKEGDEFLSPGDCPRSKAGHSFPTFGGMLPRS